MYTALLLVAVLPFTCQAGLVGGKTDIQVDAKDANVQFALMAINGFYAKQGDNEARDLVKVVKAQSQVVAGTLYSFLLDVKSSAGEELCEVEIWSRPWLSGDDAMQVSTGPACKPQDKGTQDAAKPLVGGETPIDKDSTDVQNALTFAVNAMNSKENFLYLRKATNIGEVTSQVVSGIAYHFKGVEMSATECPKGSNQALETCNVSATNNVLMCDFDIWWQAWMTPEYKIGKMECK